MDLHKVIRFWEINFGFYMNLSVWSPVIYILFALCIVLYVLNVYWIYQIMKKVILVFTNNIVEDLCSIKKRSMINK